MPFSPALAWLIATGTVGFLLLAAKRNQRHGWARHRNDDLFDVLMLWARIRHGHRRGLPVAAPPAEASTAAPLLALHSAVHGHVPDRVSPFSLAVPPSGSPSQLPAEMVSRERR